MQAKEVPNNFSFKKQKSQVEKLSISILALCYLVYDGYLCISHNLTTFSAAGPFGPSTMSKLTRCPSSKDL